MGLFVGEAPTADGGDLVKARAAVVLRQAPGRLDPAGLGHAMEGRVERAGLEPQHLVGNLLDSLGNREAVHGLRGGESPQHEEVEGALQLVFAVVSHRYLLGDHTLDYRPCANSTSSCSQMQI